MASLFVKHTTTTEIEKGYPQGHAVPRSQRKPRQRFENISFLY